MRSLRLSDLALFCKIGLAPLLALLALGFVATWALCSKAEQGRALASLLAGTALQNQIAAATVQLDTANAALEKPWPENATAASQLDAAENGLRKLQPGLSPAMRPAIAAVFTSLDRYRGAAATFAADPAALYADRQLQLSYGRLSAKLNLAGQQAAALSMQAAMGGEAGAGFGGMTFGSFFLFALLALPLASWLIVAAIRSSVAEISRATAALGGEREAVEVAMLAGRAEQERMTRMITVLSETSETMLRAESSEILFARVCEAAAAGGQFLNVNILQFDPETHSMAVVAAAGPIAAMMAAATPVPEIRRATRPGLAASAIVTGVPCISNDYLAEQRSSPFYEMVSGTGTRSVAALPLFSRGKIIGAFLLMSAECDTFTPKFVEILQRLAANVSFGLDFVANAVEREKAEERIRYLANHDSLTGLPNRSAFNQLLSFSIRNAQRYNRKCAILFIDLDRFKLINDSLGHAAGDALLVEMARRLQSMVRASDVVARLGGDEFMILLSEISGREEAEGVAHQLLTAFSTPLVLSGYECRVTASIGAAMFPQDGEDEQTLMKNADSAMYVAKEEGKNDVRFFSPEATAPSIDRLKIENLLQHAIERNELCLHYQPKLNVLTGKVAGVEALLRWVHPELGMLPPMQFIPVAEESGLIIMIGKWVIDTACAQNMAWQRAGAPPVSMAINVSPRQFSDASLLQDIDDALAASGMDPKYLQIEITESMVMLNVDRAVRVLDAIQSRGVRLAIDDFGTGYSSMSMLKRFPIDTIKIDRSFVRDLPDNSEDKAIAQAIINMGKALGLTIVAEGVETSEQDAFLRENACDEIQGYLFSKPLTAASTYELLNALNTPQPIASSPSRAALVRPAYPSESRDPLKLLTN